MFGMFGFVRQSTYDADIAEKDAEIALLMKEIVETGVLLTKAREHIGWADNQNRHAQSERDAARAERDTAQRERDEARSQLLRFTGPRDRGPGGRFVKVQAQRSNGTAAAVQGALS